MKVCAHYNLGPFNQHFMRCSTKAKALSEFREQLEIFYGDLEGILERTGEEYAPSISLYPQCDDCASNMCFHDYPMSHYRVGPRGGIRKEFV